jgi:hypothetical protein
LHLSFDAAEPILNVSFTLDWLIELDVFLSTTKDLMDRFDESSVGGIESDAVDSIEQLLEVILDHLWVRSKGENLQEILVGAEVESWEYTSLLLQVALKSLLAEVEVLLETSERVEEDIVLAALDDVLLLAGSFHDLLP